MKNHPLYWTWWGMMDRCYRKTAINYPSYGGRGVTVCQRWHSFENFVADMGDKSDPALTLERIDNNAPYSPENCKWDTRTNQCHNRSKFSNNTSGYPGVWLQKSKWLAVFQHERVRYNLGYFPDAESAAQYRDAFKEMFFSDRTAALAMLPPQRQPRCEKRNLMF